MALLKKKRGGKQSRALAGETVSTNPFADDLTKILGYVSTGEGKKADVIRALLSEAIEAREEGKEVVRHGEKRVKRLQLEAISEGTKSLEEKVDELLEISRRGGVSLGNLSNLAGDNLGVAFEVLKLIEAVFAMVSNDVTKPRLTERLKETARVEETLGRIESRAEGRAVEKVERVRKEVRSSARAA